MQKTCFFIGHRDADRTIVFPLLQKIEHCITADGVLTFVVGSYGNFDAMAARAVLELKKQYPPISLIRLLPYHPVDRPDTLPEGFDSTLYPVGMESVPKRVAIPRANRWMIDHATHLIAYVQHPASNAQNLLNYAKSRAQKHKLCIVQLFCGEENRS